MPMHKHLIAAALLGGAVAISGGVPAVARPQALPKVAEERVLPLQGGQNFRDLGGYRAADGRTVKWGMLYRSGSMNGLTVADYRELERRGIRAVCDFRDRNERAREPVNWPAGMKPAVFADDYDLDTGAMMRTLTDPALTPAKAEAMMTAFYPDLLTRFNGQYRRMFAQLLAGNAPLAFNCSAGKDRTGVAAALLLTALGVPRETVIADYMLSNRYFNPTRARQVNDESAAFIRRMDPGVQRKLMGVERSYIGAVFARMDAHRGGAMGYLRDELGLSAADITKLRALYLR